MKITIKSKTKDDQSTLIKNALAVYDAIETKINKEKNITINFEGCDWGTMTQQGRVIPFLREIK